MHVHDHLPLNELQRIAKAIPEKRLWKRYQAVILAIQGDTSADIAQALGCSQRSVQVWVNLYNDQGPEALRERPHHRPTATPGRGGAGTLPPTGRGRTRPLRTAGPRSMASTTNASSAMSSA